MSHGTIQSPRWQLLYAARWPPDAMGRWSGTRAWLCVGGVSGVSRYEHLAYDISPAALHYVGAAVTGYLKQFTNIKSETLVELENFRNEIDARLQRAALGEHDESKPEPILNGDL